MKLTAQDLLRIPHTGHQNTNRLKGTAITGVSTESRTTKQGDAFLALRGEHYDAHKFVDAAFARGAVVAIVEREGVAAGDIPLVIVDDSAQALGSLARMYRDKFPIPVLAVGGSNGKTTTKEMVSKVLTEKYTVLSTDGNLNNHVGVPQTIFRLSSKHDIAVVELGTNHPGEIAYLCRVLGPTHALLTNIGREHLEFFGSLDGVEEEEGRLFDAVRSAKGGTAIVNADDPRVAEKAVGMKKAIHYGFTKRSSAVRGRRLALNKTGCAAFEFTTPAMRGWRGVQLSIPGAHNAANALAAAAVGFAFKVPAGKIQRALESCQASSRRMETMVIGGVLIINDAYNANPDSTIAALRTLAATERKGKKIAVLGDMKELGAQAEEEHTAVGKEAAELNIDYLLTFGSHARWIHDAAGIEGAIHYDHKNVLAEYLAELVAPGDAVLIKGSRGMKMEDIVVFLQQPGAGNHTTMQ